MMSARAILVALACAALLAVPLPSLAAQVGNDTIISADQLSFDESLNLAIARGNVQIVSGDRVLLSDTLTYNERDDVVSASGNVIMLEPSGAVYFADYMELHDKMKRGVIDKLRVLWTDNTRFAVDRADFVSGTEKRFSRVVMSPCDLCKEDPTRAPLWQIKADEIVHDEVTHDIVIHDAWLEMYGIPVAYTPYLSKPDPTVNRRTGFLTPTLGHDSNFGFSAQIPYYIDISPSIDLTLSPIFFTNEYPAMVAEYRQHFSDGTVEVLGSGTYASKQNNLGQFIPGDELRGHIEGHGQFDIDNTWRWGFNVHRATDNTYLRQYGFDSPTTLVSNAYIEGFNKRDYASGETIFFQGQRATDLEGDTPLVVPFLQFDHLGEPDAWGGRLGVDGSLLNIVRTESTNTFRLAMNGEWALPFVFEDGQMVKLAASLLGELYWADILDFPNDPFGPSHEVVTGRVYPQLTAEWRYPWVRRSGTTQQVIEPIVQMFVAPPDPNTSDIPNEDSVDLIFSDSNVFEPNRFPGIDRLDGGMRIVYGLNMGVYGDRGGFSSVFVGQSYRLFGDTQFSKNSGLEDPLSDFVGRIEVQPITWANVIARFRVDKDNFAARVIEIDSNFFFDPVSLGVNYVFVDETTSDPVFATREEVDSDIRVQLTDYWRVTGSQRYDLEAGQPISSRVGAFYSDECFDLGIQYERRFFSDSFFNGDNRFFFSVVFKNLGEVSTNI
jgi:LPS-assembly protein